MKKYILPLLIIAVLGMTSCNEDKAASTDTATENVTNSDANNIQNIAPEGMEASTEVVSNPTTFKMNKMEHDFGTISDVDHVHTTFTITNTGKEPLIITSAKGSCGCTVPTYPTAPIAPGESGDIEVSFDPAGKPGVNTKTVTLIANTEPANTVLTIKAVVNALEK